MVAERGPAAERAIAGFLAKYTPLMREQFETVRDRLQSRFPHGFELVYDTYNALAIGYSPTQRASDVIVSIAAYPRWITLFFLKGSALPDPTRRLQGTGPAIRSVRLASPATLDEADVQELLDHAIDACPVPFEQASALQPIVKSVAPKQRPRRPAERAKA